MSGAVYGPVGRPGNRFRFLGKALRAAGAALALWLLLSAPQFHPQTHPQTRTRTWTLTAPEPGVADAAALPGPHFLTVHGPNDGEPLSSLSRFRFETNYPKSGRILIYRQNTYVDQVTVSEAGAAGNRVAAEHRLDSRQFENTLLVLRFHFFTPAFDGHISTAEWRGTVDNPRIHLPEKALQALITVRIEGRARDEEYLLAAGNDRRLLESPPEDGMPIAGVQALVIGGFSPRNPGKQSLEFVLNLDTLFQIHGANLQLVLWTRHPIAGWSHSRITEMRSILPEAASRSLPGTQGGTSVTTGASTSLYTAK